MHDIDGLARVVLGLLVQRHFLGLQVGVIAGLVHWRVGHASLAAMVRSISISTFTGLHSPIDIS